MRMALSYLYYRLNARNLHGVHSPFFYSLNENVLRKKGYPNEEKAEALRKQLKKNKRKIHIVDLGAGSRVNPTNFRTVSEIARTSSGSAKDLALLHNLTSWLQAKNILELGSNLGLGTFALCSTQYASRVISIEGDTTLAAIAVKNLEKLGAKAEIIQGSFEEKLDLALNKLGKVDFAYLDGNHRKIPTLTYFEEIKKYADNNTVIAIADIHWSREMEQAWEEMKIDQSVTATVDVFSMGLIFFRKQLSKEHFTLYG